MLTAGRHAATRPRTNPECVTSTSIHVGSVTFEARGRQRLGVRRPNSGIWLLRHGNFLVRRGGRFANHPHLHGGEDCFYGSAPVPSKACFRRGQRRPEKLRKWFDSAGSPLDAAAHENSEMMKIVMGSEPRLLNILRAVVTFRAQEAGLTKAEAEYVALAIDEAAANVIRHTYCGRHDALFAVELRRLPDRLEFILEDWGPKVCQDQIRPRPLDELRPGGLGTYFIYSFMDECSYDPDCQEGNRLKLVKFLSRKDTWCNEGSSAKSG